MLDFPSQNIRPAIMFRVALIACLIFSLSACGFHLRGYRGASSVKAATVYIDARRAPGVEQQLRDQLGAGGARVVDDITVARYVIGLRNESVINTVLSVSARTGKAEEYQLTSRVQLSVQDRNGEQLIEEKPIALNQDFTIDEDTVLGSFSEEEVLTEELIHDTAAEIIRLFNAAIDKQ